MDEFIISDPLPSSNTLGRFLTKNELKRITTCVGSAYQALSQGSFEIPNLVTIYIQKEWWKPIIVPPTIAGNPVLVEVGLLDRWEYLSDTENGIEK